MCLISHSKRGVFGSNIQYFMNACGKEFEDTKVVIRMRKSKQDRQHNGAKRKQWNIHIKLQIE